MIVWFVVCAAIVMMVVEARSPGRSFPKVRGWWLRALALNGVQVVVVLTAGRLWDGWLREHRPWSADRLGVELGAFLGYVAITFVYYWWHRWRHESSFLWRVFHQVHHSPQRIEVITSFYKHPLEILVNGLLSSAILYVLVGLAEPAAVGAVLLSGFAELVYHWNVRTPHWFGYVFQRPESHCVHHQEGYHTKNFADLPLWDMLFGTFENPRHWNGRTGFGPNKEGRLLEMLRWKDINAERAQGEHP